MQDAATLETPKDLASPEEVRAALAGLSGADSLRLRQIAKLRSANLPSMEWSDLLSEAIVRALDGQRRWPRRVPFVAFVAQTMRSIASETYWATSAEVPLSVVGGAEGRDGESPDVDAANDVTPEREAAAREGLARVESLFDDDPIGLAVLLATSEGRSPEDTKTELNINPTQYASALRRVRRRLANF